jgi:hypothetical protein
MTPQSRSFVLLSGLPSPFLLLIYLPIPAIGVPAVNNRYRRVPTRVLKQQSTARSVQSMPSYNPL